MKIAVFGATGIAGRAIVDELLNRGFNVTVLTRHAASVSVRHKRLNVIEGCVTDSSDIRKVIEGQDAVVQTLGIGGKGNGKPTTFVSEANRLIMDEMEAMGVRRFIAISVIGAGDSLFFMPWIYRNFVMPLFMKWFVPIIEDKNRMETMIRKSKLDWTIVRCTTIENIPPRGNVKVSFDGKGIKYSIAAADMAAFFADCISENRYRLQTPVVCDS